jgi:hypothetical protein
MNEAQEHAVTRTHERTHPDFEYASCEDPGDCDPIVKADVPDAPPEEIMDPVAVLVRRK